MFLAPDKTGANSFIVEKQMKCMKIILAALSVIPMVGVAQELDRLNLLRSKIYQLMKKVDNLPENELNNMDENRRNKLIKEVGFSQDELDEVREEAPKEYCFSIKNNTEKISAYVSNGWSGVRAYDEEKDKTLRPRKLLFEEDFPYIIDLIFMQTRHLTETCVNWPFDWIDISRKTGFNRNRDILLEKVVTITFTLHENCTITESKSADEYKKAIYRALDHYCGGHNYCEGDLVLDWKYEEKHSDSN